MLDTNESSNDEKGKERADDDFSVAEVEFSLPRINRVPDFHHGSGVFDKNMTFPRGYQDPVFREEVIYYLRLMGLERDSDPYALVWKYSRKTLGAHITDLISHTENTHSALTVAKLLKYVLLITGSEYYHKVSPYGPILLKASLITEAVTFALKGIKTLVYERDGAKFLQLVVGNGLRCLIIYPLTVYCPYPVISVFVLVVNLYLEHAFEEHTFDILREICCYVWRELKRPVNKLVEDAQSSYNNALKVAQTLGRVAYSLSEVMPRAMVETDNLEFLIQYGITPEAWVEMASQAPILPWERPIKDRLKDDFNKAFCGQQLKRRNKQLEVGRNIDASELIGCAEFRLARFIADFLSGCFGRNVVSEEPPEWSDAEHLLAALLIYSMAEVLLPMPPLFLVAFIPSELFQKCDFNFFGPSNPDAMPLSNMCSNEDNVMAKALDSETTGPLFLDGGLKAMNLEKAEQPAVAPSTSENYHLTIKNIEGSKDEFRGIVVLTIEKETYVDGDLSKIEGVQYEIENNILLNQESLSDTPVHVSAMKVAYKEGSVVEAYSEECEIPFDKLASQDLLLNVLDDSSLTPGLDALTVGISELMAQQITSRITGRRAVTDSFANIDNGLASVATTPTLERETLMEMLSYSPLFLGNPVADLPSWEQLRFASAKELLASTAESVRSSRHSLFPNVQPFKSPALLPDGYQVHFSCIGKVPRVDFRFPLEDAPYVGLVIGAGVIISEVAQHMLRGRYTQKSLQHHIKKKRSIAQLQNAFSESNQKLNKLFSDNAWFDADQAQQAIYHLHKETAFNHILEVRKKEQSDLQSVITNREMIREQETLLGERLRHWLSGEMQQLALGKTQAADGFRKLFFSEAFRRQNFKFNFTKEEGFKEKFERYMVNHAFELSKKGKHSDAFNQLARVYPEIAEEKNKDIVSKALSVISSKMLAQNPRPGDPKIDLSNSLETTVKAFVETGIGNAELNADLRRILRHVAEQRGDNDEALRHSKKLTDSEHSTLRDHLDGLRLKVETDTLEMTEAVHQIKKMLQSDVRLSESDEKYAQDVLGYICDRLIQKTSSPFVAKMRSAVFDVREEGYQGLEDLLASDYFKAGSVVNKHSLSKESIEKNLRNAYAWEAKQALINTEENDGPHYARSIDYAKKALKNCDADDLSVVKERQYCLAYAQVRVGDAKDPNDANRLSGIKGFEALLSTEGGFNDGLDQCAVLQADVKRQLALFHHDPILASKHFSELQASNPHTEKEFLYYVGRCVERGEALSNSYTVDSHRARSAFYHEAFEQSRKMMTEDEEVNLGVRATEAHAYRKLYRLNGKNALLETVGFMTGCLKKYCLHADLSNNKVKAAALASLLFDSGFRVSRPFWRSYFTAGSSTYEWETMRAGDQALLGADALLAANAFVAVLGNSEMIDPNTKMLMTSAMDAVLACNVVSEISTLLKAEAITKLQFLSSASQIGVMCLPLVPYAITAIDTYRENNGIEMSIDYHNRRTLALKFTSHLQIAMGGMSTISLLAQQELTKQVATKLGVEAFLGSAAATVGLVGVGTLIVIALTVNDYRKLQKQKKIHLKVKEAVTLANAGRLDRAIDRIKEYQGTEVVDKLMCQIEAKQLLKKGDYAGATERLERHYDQYKDGEIARYLDALRHFIIAQRVRKFMHEEKYDRVLTILSKYKNACSSSKEKRGLQRYTLQPLFFSKQYDQVIKSATELLSFDRHDYFALYWRANAYMEMNEFEFAYIDFKSRMALAKDHCDKRKQVAIIKTTHECMIRYYLNFMRHLYQKSIECLPEYPLFHYYKMFEAAKTGGAGTQLLDEERKAFEKVVDQYVKQPEGKREAVTVDFIWLLSQPYLLLAHGIAYSDQSYDCIFETFLTRAKLALEDIGVLSWLFKEWKNNCTLAKKVEDSNGWKFYFNAQGERVIVNASVLGKYSRQLSSMAIEMLNYLVTSEYKAGEAHFYLARVYYQNADYKNARQQIDDAIAVFERHEEKKLTSLFREAENLKFWIGCHLNFVAENYHDCIEKCLSRSDDVTARSLLSACYQKIGDCDSAILMLEWLLDNNENSINTLISLATLLVKRSEEESAADCDAGMEDKVKAKEHCNRALQLIKRMGFFEKYDQRYEPTDVLKFQLEMDVLITEEDYDKANRLCETLLVRYSNTAERGESHFRARASFFAGSEGGSSNDIEADSLVCSG